MQMEEIQNIYNETVLPSYREMGKNFQKVESSTVEVPPPPKSVYYCAKMKHIGKHWKKRFLDRFGYLGFYLLITVILIVGSFLVHYFAIHGKFFVVSPTLKKLKEKKNSSHVVITLFLDIFQLKLLEIPPLPSELEKI